MTSASAAIRRALKTKHFSKCRHLKREQRSGSADTSSHTSERGCVGRSLSEPSFVVDVGILLKTALKVVKRDGIAAAGHATMPEFMGTAERRSA